MRKPPDVPFAARRALVCAFLLALLACPASNEGTARPASPAPPGAREDGGGAAPSARTDEDKDKAPVKPVRPSSFRACGRSASAPGGCDLGEACDFTTYDWPCGNGPCEGPQSGDQRCHRICDDATCGPGETCVVRPVRSDDTGGERLPLCLCAGKQCPERGPGALAWPAEGDLAPWRPERDMPVDLYYHAAASSPARVYVSGGLSVLGNTPESARMEINRKVFSAPVLADGGLGAWEESGQLPKPLDQHAMAVAAGRLFVAGGAADGGFTNAVWSAPLRAKGSLGPWRKEAVLPMPRASHALVAHGDTLWVVGGSIRQGHSDGTPGLLRARLSSEGEARLSPWEALEAPVVLHYRQGVAVANGRLYAAQEEGRLYSAGLDTQPRWREEETPPWMRQVDFRKSGWHDLNLMALPGQLLALMPRGLTLTADLQADGTVKNWRLASRLYNTDSAFAATSGPGGRVYVFGGTNGQGPLARNAEVWSTTRLAP